MAAERKAPRVVLAALVLVIGLSVLLGTRWLRHARVERARQRLEAVAVPVYPGAKDVKRHVMMKPMVVLLVGYQAPVSYPSKAVVDFYDDRLLPQGWVQTKALPARDRQWHE
nr:hypothetical protein [Gemmatimonadales bacterium]